MASGATELLLGSVDGQPEEPTAWTFERADGGKSFYTSLGHVQDFDNPSFIRLLLNSTYWAAGLPVPENVRLADSKTDYHRDWAVTQVPGKLKTEKENVVGSAKVHDAIWYRCAVRIPAQWSSADLSLYCPNLSQRAQAWLNGRKLVRKAASNALSVMPQAYELPSDALFESDANLLVLRFAGRERSGLDDAPSIRYEGGSLTLAGNWQVRIGDDPSWSNLPLPAKFGAAPDILFEP